VSKDLNVVQLLKCLRGKVSQTELNTALGLPINTVNKWENSKKNIKWNEFLKLCEWRQVDLASILDRRVRYRWGLSSHQGLLKHLTQGDSITSIANECGLSYNIVYGWFHKERSPLLVHFLRILKQYSSTSYTHFYNEIYELCGEDNIHKDARSLIYSQPRSILLLELLELKKYVHAVESDLEQISNISKIPAFQIKSLLEEFLAIGYLKKINNFITTRKESIFLATQKREFVLLVKYWFQDLIRKSFLCKEKNSTFLSFGVYRFKDENLDELRKLTYNYLQSIEKIAESDELADEVRVITLSLYDPIAEEVEDT